MYVILGEDSNESIEMPAFETHTDIARGCVNVTDGAARRRDGIRTAGITSDARTPFRGCCAPAGVLRQQFVLTFGSNLRYYCTFLTASFVNVDRVSRKVDVIDLLIA